MPNAIFLDIDGVLNDIYTTERINGYVGIDSEKVELLAELVSHTQSDLILTSTWKDYWNTHGEYLNSKLAEQGLSLKGRTYEKDWSCRADGIRQASNGYDNIIILDDFWFDWGDLTPFWVDTLEESLTKALVEEVKAKFDGGQYDTRKQNREESD